MALRASLDPSDQPSKAAATESMPGDPVRHTATVNDFEAWLDSLHLQDSDPGGDVGQLAPGAMEVLRDLFDQRGPISREEVNRAGHQLQTAHADRSVNLLRADIRRTTTLTPDIAVRRSAKLLTVFALTSSTIYGPSGFNVWPTGTDSTHARSTESRLGSVPPTTMSSARSASYHWPPPTSRPQHGVVSVTLRRKSKSARPHERRWRSCKPTSMHPDSVSSRCSSLTLARTPIQ